MLSVYYADLGLDDLGFRAQAAVSNGLGRVPDWVLPLGVLALAGGIWVARGAGSSATRQRLADEARETEA